MTIIDAQLHAYERNHPGRPWAGVLAGPAQATGEQTVAMLDASGVDGAILVSAFTMYRYDPSYAVEVRNRYPDRFALVKPVDPADPGVGENIAEWKRLPGTVGIRMLLVRSGLATDATDPGLNAVMATATRLSIPVNLHIAGRLEQGIELIRRHPDAEIVVDHLGLVQPHEHPAPEKPWAELDQVLSIARFPNVAMKITGACTLSHQKYPFDDIWDPVCRMIEAFGVDRCMWGTDWSRAVAFLDHRQGIDALRETKRISDSDKAKLLSENAARIYRWRPGKR